MPFIIAANISKPSRCHSVSGILLPHRPQVDALLEVVHLLEVLAPALVDDAQHHLALDLAHRLVAELVLAALVVAGGVVEHELADLVGRAGTR